MPLNHTVLEVTQRIRERSRESRADYLDRMMRAGEHGPNRKALSCGNLAHGFAACPAASKKALAGDERPNIAIVSAYNEMLSAHQPYHRYPDIIKDAAWKAGGVAQFAGGVPAMCDGVTQGQPGMELSLFSRDTVAMATAIALTHNMFDGTLCLGICDKIVPGLLIGALSFGHLPTVFVPAGPMPSGLSNPEKSKVRQAYAEGKIGDGELLQAESRAYHSPGTCTFYGTANSNQLLMEFMGLQLPGSSFVNPNDRLRDAFTSAAAERIVGLATDKSSRLCNLVDERAIVNAIVGLLASGGSTNHTMHIVAIARAAGIIVDWDDFSALSDTVPLLARIYPNGPADINHFQRAGGIPALMRALLDLGLLHDDVETVAGVGLERYTAAPKAADGSIDYDRSPAVSKNPEIIASGDRPFAPTGGIRLLTGSLGRSIIKISAVAAEHHVVEGVAKVFDDQNDAVSWLRAHRLEEDTVVVVRFQGPRANGMPELHKLTPILGVHLDRGVRVALVTDGRMSGASGKVPAAIQLTPEAASGGLLAKLQDGDRIRLDAGTRELTVMIDDAELAARPAAMPAGSSQHGFGREIYRVFRDAVSSAESGASCIAQ